MSMGPDTKFCECAFGKWLRKRKESLLLLFIVPRCAWTQKKAAHSANMILELLKLIKYQQTWCVRSLRSLICGRTEADLGSVMGGTLRTCGWFFIAFVPWELAALVIYKLLLSLKSKCSSLKVIIEETIQFLQETNKKIVNPNVTVQQINPN